MTENQDNGQYDEKLFIQIMKLSHKLGWYDMRLFGHFYDNEIIFHFSEGKMDSLYFQVNVRTSICCMLYDIPHGIHIDWHKINVQQLTSNIDAELLRLSPIFSKSIFLSSKKRKLLCVAHPGFFGFTWATDGGVIDAAGKHVWPDCTKPIDL